MASLELQILDLNDFNIHLLLFDEQSHLSISETWQTEHLAAHLLTRAESVDKLVERKLMWELQRTGPESCYRRWFALLFTVWRVASPSWTRIATAQLGRYTILFASRETEPFARQVWRTVALFGQAQNDKCFCHAWSSFFVVQCVRVGWVGLISCTGRVSSFGWICIRCWGSCVWGFFYAIQIGHWFTGGRCGWGNVWKAALKVCKLVVGNEWLLAWSSWLNFFI